MAVISERASGDSRPETTNVAADRPRSRPVVWWATVGVLYLCVVAYELAHWIASGQAVRTEPGSLPPVWQRVELRAFDIVLPMIGLWMLWRLVVRPLRRERRLGIEGMFLITYLTMNGQDIWMNYLKPMAYFNSYSFNLGSWFNALPGWNSPNSHLNGEPFLANLPFYMLGGCAVTLGGVRVMRWLYGRYPRLSPGQTVLTMYVMFFLLDIVLEGLVVLGGAYNYLPNLPGPALFKGHHYQLPIWEPLFWGLIWTAGASLLFFRDDQGRTIAERGEDRLNISTGKRQLVRLLAMIGIMNVTMLVLYDIPWNIIGVQAGRLPRDTPAYILNAQCGPGTAYECMSQGQPIQRQGAPGAHSGSGAYPAGYFHDATGMIRSAQRNLHN